MGLTRLRAEQISDIDYKQAVRVITISNINLSGGAPNNVDGVTLSVNDRILVNGQTTGSQNGIYQVDILGTGSNGTWIRSIDTNATGELEAGTIVMVTEGTVYKDTQWKLTTNNPIIIGTTALTFEQNSAFAFGNIFANGTAVLANTVGDVLTLTAGNNIEITGNNTSKTVTIGVTGISLNSISNGTSNVNVVSSGGNVTVGVGGTANVAEFSTGGLQVTGFASTSGNVTGGNVLTAGVVSAAANVTGGNILTTGLVSATSNIAGGNLLTAGLVSATGNITGANINLSGNIVDTNSLTISTGTGDLNLNPAGNVNLNNRYLNGLINPTQDQDAATKNYVDNLVSTAISYHQPVVAATTANLATTTGGTITYAQPGGAGNGIGATITTTGSFDLIDTANVQTANTRILVKDEGNAVLNGVYVWSNATVITRATDADEYGAGNVNALGINDYFFVSSGNINKGSAYVVSAPTGTITFGTSNITFAQFSNSQTYTANTAAGISLAGTVINAKVDNNTTAFDGGGNITVKAGANLTTPNIGAATGTSLSTTGNITGNYLFGNGSQLTGVNVSTNSISNGTSNVVIATANGNVNIYTAGQDTVEVSPGELTVYGVYSNPKTISSNVVIGPNINSMLIGPIEVDPNNNIFVPTGSTLNII
jgi:hypothetical protein